MKLLSTKRRENIRYNIVDVGAGLKSRYKDWLLEFPGLIIYAIEPHPEIAEDLRKLGRVIDEETLNATPGRLRVYEFAATDNDDAKCTFYLSNDKSSSSTLPFVTANIRKWKYPLGRRMFKTVGEIIVCAKTLHAFFKDENLRAISLLNIDTQGNALEVLKGLGNRNWDNIHEINVKVHSIDWELYQGQTVNYKVIDLCRRKYFTFSGRQQRTRNQEDVLCFQSDLFKIRDGRFGWSKRATMPML